MSSVDVKVTNDMTSVSLRDASSVNGRVVVIEANPYRMAFNDSRRAHHPLACAWPGIVGTRECEPKKSVMTGAKPGLSLATLWASCWKKVCCCEAGVRMDPTCAIAVRRRAALAVAPRKGGRWCWRVSASGFSCWQALPIRKPARSGARCRSPKSMQRAAIEDGEAL